ncbi:MAG: preprotein translocase subunit SecE [Planctomycetaceae bacterium]
MKKNAETTLWSEMLTVSFYKRNQGRLTRQLTAAAILVIVFFGLWRLSQGPLAGEPAWLRVGIPTLVFAAAAWGAFRAVNYPRFADFLISVQAEMDKVSWSTWPELWRATAVVVGTMFLLAVVLFVYDQLWVALFRLLGILQI